MHACTLGKENAMFRLDNSTPVVRDDFGGFGSSLLKIPIDLLLDERMTLPRGRCATSSTSNLGAYAVATH